MIEVTCEGLPGSPARKACSPGGRTCDLMAMVNRQITLASRPERPELGPRWLDQLIVKQAKVQGFLVSAYAERFPEALEQLAVWLRQGKLRYREDVALGIEATPQAFIGMLRGDNQGKQLVQLSEL